jgi:NAD(P)-dependent dehydrogenase (short-subunit alcohol dehydrogenase family)
MNGYAGIFQHNFAGRTIAITGGAGALGSVVAEALAWAGANVAVLDRSAEAGERLVQKIDRSDAGGRVLFIQTDVLQRDSLAAAEARIRAELGPVDALVNTAGGNHPAATTGAYAAGGAPAPSFFDLTEAGMRAVFDLNFLGTFLPCQAFGLGMVERGEGAILNITSIVSVRPLTRIPAYAAAKAAVSSFTQWLAVYMAQNHSPRIRVNALAPGFFMSEQSRFLALDSETGEVSPRARSVIAHTPVGRYGEPEELLGAVLWLLSPASTFVTGSVICVDGGFTAYSGV